MEEKGEVVSCLWVLRRFFSDGEQFFLAGGVANVATHPAVRGRGFASQLLERGINVARKEELSFLVLVTDILSFYERFGFKDCKRWVSQVEPGEGKSIELAKPQTGEILGCYRAFYQKETVVDSGEKLHVSSRNATVEPLQRRFQNGKRDCILRKRRRGDWIFPKFYLPPADYF